MWRTIDREILIARAVFAPFAPYSRRRPGPPQIAEGVARARLSGFQPVLLRQKPGRGMAGFLGDRLLHSRYALCTRHGAGLPWPAAAGLAPPRPKKMPQRLSAGFQFRSGFPLVRPAFSETALSSFASTPSYTEHREQTPGRGASLSHSHSLPLVGEI